jgi:hypothetical protein
MKFASIFAVMFVNFLMWILAPQILMEAELVWVLIQACKRLTDILFQLDDWGISPHGEPPPSQYAGTVL